MEIENPFKKIKVINIEESRDISESVVSDVPTSLNSDGLSSSDNLKSPNDSSLLNLSDSNSLNVSLISKKSWSHYSKFCKGVPELYSNNPFKDSNGRSIVYCQIQVNGKLCGAEVAINGNRVYNYVSHVMNHHISCALEEDLIDLKNKNKVLEKEIEIFKKIKNEKIKDSNKTPFSVSKKFYNFDEMAEVLANCKILGNLPFSFTDSLWFKYLWY